MDFSDFSTLVNNVAFPIVACWLLFKQNDKIIDKVTNTINKNTIAINKVLTALENKEVSEIENQSERN